MVTLEMIAPVFSEQLFPDILEAVFSSGKTMLSSIMSRKSLFVSLSFHVCKMGLLLEPYLEGT